MCAIFNRCQKLVEKKENLDLKRLGIMSFLGGALVGPVLHAWYVFGCCSSVMCLGNVLCNFCLNRYGVLGKIVTFPGTKGTLAMLGLDQFGFAPVFVATFISSVCVLEVKPVDC